MNFLLVIPAFCESGRLPAYLEGLADALGRNFPQARILVVDDGSPPGEAEELRRRVDRIRAARPGVLAPLFLSQNKGKGGAILAGWKAAEGFDYVGFVDADGSVSAGEVCRVASLLGEDEPPAALFGARLRMAGRLVERSLSRHLAGRCFATLVGTAIDSSVYDTQCGLKFVPRASFARVAPLLLGERFAFDVELLAALRAEGCPVREVPIDWSETPGSKVRFARDSWQMAWAVLAIRWRAQKWARRAPGGERAGS